MNNDKQAAGMLGMAFAADAIKDKEQSDMRAKYDKLKASHEKLIKALELVEDELDEDNIHSTQNCEEPDDCILCIIAEVLKEAEQCDKQ